MTDALAQLLMLLLILGISYISQKKAREQRERKAEEKEAEAAREAEPPRPPPTRVQPEARPAMPTIAPPLMATRRAKGRARPAPTSDGELPMSLAAAGRQRRKALARLTGGLALRPGLPMARAGILWSEVLGPPRALMGPQRTPAARRHDR